MLKIIADSTCNLAADVLQQHDIRVAPITIQFGNESYEEGISIDRPFFYRKIEEMGIIPTTSQPSPAWFARYFEELARQAHQILAITITGKLSGTYDSALLAKSMVPQADVEVFDSRSISLGTGWMILEAARAAAAGQDRASILERLNVIRERARLFLTPATLKYLQMSGRVGPLQGILGSILEIKPIITLRDGVLEVVEKIRTRGKALRHVVESLEKAVGTKDPVNLAIIHARALEDAQVLLEMLKARLNIRETLIGDLVASLAVHGGPGIVGAFAYRV